MKIVVASPWIQTAGPEALHQLVNTINGAMPGYKAGISYYQHGPIAPPQTGYIPDYQDSYSGLRRDQNFAVDSFDSSDTVVVLPEAIWQVGFQFKRARVAIWHLGSSALEHPSFGQNLKRIRSDFLHFCQGEFMMEWAHDLGLKPVLLEDYIHPDFTRAPSEREQNRDGFITNARGLGFASQVLPSAQIRCFMGLRRKEVIYLLDSSKVWLGCGEGSLHGTDRGNAEAALRGCCVVAMRTPVLGHPSIPLTVCDSPQVFARMAQFADENYLKVYDAQQEFRAWAGGKRNRHLDQVEDFLREIR
jgi:hypothetical protein